MRLPPEDVREALAGGRAVASLGAVLGGGNREDGSAQAFIELAEGTLALLLVQSDRRRQIQAELDARVRRVDALAAGARGVGETLDQLPRGHDEAARAAGPGGNAEIVHGTSVHYPPGPRYFISSATRFFRSGSMSAANQGFFFIHIWLRGEGWTSGKYVGR